VAGTSTLRGESTGRVEQSTGQTLLKAAGIFILAIFVFGAITAVLTIAVASPVPTSSERSLVQFLTAVIVIALAALEASRIGRARVAFRLLVPCVGLFLYSWKRAKS